MNPQRRQRMRAIISSFRGETGSVEEADVPSFGKKVAKYLRKNWLFLCLFGAIIFGLIIGLLLRLRSRPYSKREVMYAGFLGVLLIRMLQAVTIPLFTTSVMVALGRLDMKTSSIIGIRTIIYFLVTSFISSVLGVILVLVMQPGASARTDGEEAISVRTTTIIDSFLDIIRNLIPSNIIEGCLFTHSTQLIPPENDTGLPPMKWDFKVNQLVATPNYLGLIAVAMCVGFAMGFMKDSIDSLINLVESTNEIFLKITTWIVNISPFGILCLIIGQVIELKDFESAISQLGMYTACNIVGLMIIAVVILPIIYSLFTRKSPFRMLYDSMPVATTAFATASSLATMPTTLKCAEEVMHVDPRISRFVIPLGATVNMNGASLYNTIGPLFLAQLSNVDVNIAHYFGVCLTATLASVGVAAIPQSGVVTMVMVMSVANVNPDLIAVVYTMDWLLDRFCTSVNVMGDIVASIVIESLSKKELEAIPRHHQQSINTGEGFFQ